MKIMNQISATSQTYRHIPPLYGGNICIMHEYTVLYLQYTLGDML